MDKETIQRQLQTLGLPPDLKVNSKFSLILKLGEEDFTTQDVANATKRKPKTQTTHATQKKRRRDSKPSGGEPPAKRQKVVAKRGERVLAQLTWRGGRNKKAAQIEESPGTEDDTNNPEFEDDEDIYDKDTDIEEAEEEGGVGLTARQRAIRHRENTGERKPLFEYGVDATTQKRQVSANEARKRQIMAKRRKEKLQEQMEEERATVVEQLLNPKAKMRGNDKLAASNTAEGGPSSGSAPRATRGRAKQQPSAVDRITYGAQGSKGQGEGRNQGATTEHKERQLCGATGCSNFKKFSDSKTGTALCSLACYKSIQA